MNADELRAERERLTKTQEEMAELLGAPISSYRKWEQGHRKVPRWVPDRLAPKALVLEGFSIQELAQIDDMAREAGLTFNAQVSQMLRQGLSEQQDRPLPTSEKPEKKEG